MNAPLVTIAISCYNHEKYVQESLLSALRQTYDSIELLVFDDGSSDSSVEIINSLKKDHDFFFKAQANQGLSKTLNDALAMANGEYFVPFGSDDIMMLDRISKQVAYMQKHPTAAICGGNMLKINEQGTLLPHPKINPAAVQTFDDVFLDRGPGIPAPTMFFRTDILREVGGFDPEIPLEDLYIKLQITSKGHTIGVMNDVLAYYRTHPTNTYKNLNYMLNNVLKTYVRFSDSEHYDTVKYKFLNSMLLKASKIDTALGLKILKMIPLSRLNKKALRALPRLLIHKRPK